MTNFFYEKYWSSIKEAPPESDSLTSKRIKIFLDFILGKHIKNILDFGCGTGVVSNELKKAGYNVIGFDVSENAINEARKRYPDVNFITGLLENNLPFKDSQFDAIYCAEVIEHIYDIEFLMQELNRVLKKKVFYLYQLLIMDF